MLTLAIYDAIVIPYPSHWTEMRVHNQSEQIQWKQQCVCEHVRACMCGGGGGGGWGLDTFVYHQVNSLISQIYNLSNLLRLLRILIASGLRGNVSATTRSDLDRELRNLSWAKKIYINYIWVKKK